MTKQSGFYWDLQGIQWKQYLGQVGEMYLKQNSQLSLHHLVTWLRNVTGPSQPQGSQRGHPGTHGLWLVGIFGLFSSLFDITGLKLLKSFLKILEKKKKSDKYVLGKKTCDYTSSPDAVPVVHNPLTEPNHQYHFPSWMYPSRKWTFWSYKAASLEVSIDYTALIRVLCIIKASTSCCQQTLKSL